jgi:hypothetical protein
MGKKKKESNVGRIFSIGLGSRYLLEAIENGFDGLTYVYKWLECPDSNYRFRSLRELDSIDMVCEITLYKVEHGIK